MATERRLADGQPVVCLTYLFALPSSVAPFAWKPLSKIKALSCSVAHLFPLFLVAATE